MWRMAEFWCDACDGRFEALEKVPSLQAKGRKSHPCPVCGRPAGRVFSAPKKRTVWGVVQRGKSEEKPHPLAQDTSALADGMSMNDWRAQRRKLRADDRRKRVRGMVS